MEGSPFEWKESIRRNPTGLQKNGKVSFMSKDFSDEDQSGRGLNAALGHRMSALAEIYWNRNILSIIVGSGKCAEFPVLDSAVYGRKRQLVCTRKFEAMGVWEF